MWMATTLGFFSVVKKEETIHVRARCEKDIEALIAFLKLKRKPIFTPRADYLWRVCLRVHEWEKAFPALAQLVIYDNFKSEIAKHNKKREALYHQVWALLLKIEKERV